MYFERMGADPRIKGSVQAVWHSQMPAGGHALIVPDAATDVVVRYDGARMDVAFCGAMTKALHLNPSRETRYWGLRFKPGHGSLFFDFPMDAAKDGLVDLSKSLERGQLQDLLQDLAGNSSRIETLVADFLSKRLDLGGDSKKAVEIDALSRVCYGDIESRAQELGLSRRQLSRIYKARFGYSARESSRLSKFKRLTENFVLHPQAALSDLALRSGFYDQSDMNNCVKDFCGMTPLALMSHLSKT